MPFLSFTPFPTLKTKRLLLRQLQFTDEKEIFAIRSNDQVNQYLDRPKIKALSEAQNFIQKMNTGIENNEWIYWAITIKSDPLLIGTICLWNLSKERQTAEVGYELYPEFQGKGIMQEALSCIINFGFQKMKLMAIEAYTHVDNESSSRLLKRNLFKKTGYNTNRPGEIIYTLSNPNP